VRLLEIGCATGDFLELARDSGVAGLLGLDVSDYCRKVAADRGLEVYSPEDPRATEKIGLLRPNLLVAWDVWEHLAAPASTLDQHLALADSQTMLALTTVDAGSAVAQLRGRRWRQFHPPTHLQYPTRRSLNDYLADRGFIIRHHTSFGYYRPLLEYFRAVGLARSPSEGRFFTLPIYLNLYDTQIVIAQRRARG
jgi:hypothetical protein